MSLLNDALKAAEQRQSRPAPSAYTGQPRPAGSGRRRPGPWLVVLVLVFAMAIGGYVYVSPVPPSPGVAEQGSHALQEADEPAHQTDAARPSESGGDKDTAIQRVAEPVAPPPEPRQEADPASTGPEPEAVAVADAGQDERSEAPRQSGSSATADTGADAPEPEQAEATASRSVSEPELTPEAVPGPSGQTERAADREPAAADPATPDAPEPEAADEPAGEMSRQSASKSAANDIKQPRQSPEQVDRDTARQIRERLARGERAAAERLASELTAAQDAPRSRYAVARGILARGEVTEALDWVPKELASQYPDLRLIRARAILAGGDLEQAVATLQQQVPPVADNVEYRVTLATLLEQQGSSDQAANHWAQLIAWDDSRAPWWVGLAIALEGRGDAPGAVRAYEQAAALPDLAPSLSDYVRQRLQALGAG